MFDRWLLLPSVWSSAILFFLFSACILSSVRRHLQKGMNRWGVHICSFERISFCFFLFLFLCCQRHFKGHRTHASQKRIFERNGKTNTHTQTNETPSTKMYTSESWSLLFNRMRRWSRLSNYVQIELCLNQERKKWNQENGDAWTNEEKKTSKNQRDPKFFPEDFLGHHLFHQHSLFPVRLAWEVSLTVSSLLLLSSSFVASK